MSTNFPSDLDALTNPTSTDKVATVDHAAQHANANDAIEALQAKVGVDSSAVTSSLDYIVKNSSSVSPGHKHVLNDNTDVDTTGAQDGDSLKYNASQGKFEPNATSTPDASTTVAGKSKLSVAPASATDPIAVGDNDTRVPLQGENDALVGNNTDIAVGSGNKYVTQTGLQDGAETYAADAEASDTYVITLSPAPQAYQAGQVFHFKANTANTGACTLNVNSLGAKSIVNRYNKDLFDNDIKAGQIVAVVYDGTNFQMLSYPGSQEYELESSSTNIQASADTERSTTSASYVKLKEIQIDGFGGTIHTTFQIKTLLGTWAAQGRVYVNGIAVGTERSTTSTSYQTYTEDITVVDGDLVQIYCLSATGSTTAYTKNFRVGYNVVESVRTDIVGATVNTD